MSASREKKTRRERGVDYLSPKQQKALEEQKANRRTTVLFTVGAAVILLGVVAALLWNGNVFQRGAAAARVNGKTYTVSDVAYYYYNGRASLMSNNSSLNSTASLRGQIRDDGTSWFDYLSEEALHSLAIAELTAQAAKDAGFDGGSAVDDAVNRALASAESNAANYGYGVSRYIRAIFDSLVTRSSFERTLRTVSLADAYSAAKADVSNYSDAELTGVYEAEPNAYSVASYEAAVFLDSDFASEDSEAGESAAALAVAEDAMVRCQEGESLEAVAKELGGSYDSSHAYFSAGSELEEWLFDDARKDGDATVLEYTAYYGMITGSQLVVYRGRERADSYTVDVRHILVADEATANDLLAQCNAGEKTEDAFAALATENSTDPGSRVNGGLYTGVYRYQMVAAFDDWCFDASRQTGDVGIVETSYGYHVMYFVRRSDTPYWKQLAAAKLASDWIDSLTADVQTELLDGMKYIDP